MHNDDTSTPTVSSSIFWGNDASSSGDQIYNEAPASALLSYCDVQGGYSGPGNNNIDTDPLFISSSNFGLQSSSPCIDTASPKYAPKTDFDGNPRDEYPDMGAYEY